MTLEYLSNMPYLAAEISHYNRGLDALDKMAKSADLPARMVMEYRAAISELRQAMIDNRNRCTRDFDAIQNFIDEIKDPFTQAIFIERFENNRSWWDVVGELQDEFGLSTADCAKMRVHRYLQKYKQAADSDPATPTHSIDNHA